MNDGMQIELCYIIEQIIARSALYHARRRTAMLRREVATQHIVIIEYGFAFVAEKIRFARVHVENDMGGVVVSGQFK